MNKLPTPKSMYIGTSEGGALIEGRKTMTGGSYMEPGAMTQYHELSNPFISKTQHKYMKELVQEITYTAKVRSFIPLSMLVDQVDEDHFFDDVNRIDAWCTWPLSYNEILRHNGRMEEIAATDYYEEVKSIVLTYKDDIIDLLKGYFDKIRNAGDFSLDQFRRYAKDHSASSSPFDGYKWADLVASEKKLRIAWTYTTKFIQDYCKELDDILKHKKPLIRAKYTYPALRHRKADEIKVLSLDAYSFIVKMTTHLARKAGGVKGLSQVEYPIWKNKELKHEIYGDIIKFIEKVVVMSGVHNLIIEGASFYHNILQHKGNALYCYDLSNSEKQVGNLFDFLPLQGDLGHPEYDPKLAAETYSGIGPTTIPSLLGVAFHIRYYKDKYDLSPSFLGLHGDNFIIDVDLLELEENLCFGEEERVLGFNPEKRKFWPISFMTDNPDHRVNIPKKWRLLRWTQGYQFGLRPLQLVVQQNIADSTSCERYLAWCVKHVPALDIYGKDSLNDAIYKDEVLRNKFIDEFANERAWIDEFMALQWSDPDYISDMRLQRQ
jgi:hypothetical protein